MNVNFSEPGNYNYVYRDLTGFNALPSGGFDAVFYDYGPFDEFYPLENACFWSSSFDGDDTYYFNLYYMSQGFNIDSAGSYAFSVRCIRDSE